MVQRRYTAVHDAQARFERIRPAVAELDAMMLQVKPFGPDYCILLAAREAMTTAAFHFTKEPHLFGTKPASG
jgi:hypothetical protein